MISLNNARKSASRWLAILSAGALALWYLPVNAQEAATQSTPTALAPQQAENPLGLSIHHVTMGVASIDVQRKFYHDVLGFQIGLFRNRPQYNHQQMHIPGFRLDMIEQKGSTRPTPTMSTDKQGWLHVDFSAADPGAIYARLKALGVPVTSGRMDGDKLASMTLTDPEGNRIEITVP